MKAVNEKILYVKEAIFDEMSIDEVTRRIAEVTKAPVCIADNNFRIISKDTSRAKKDISNKFAKSLLDEINDKNSLLKVTGIREMHQKLIDNKIFMKRIFVTSVHIATLIIIYSASENDTEDFELFNSITSALEKFFTHSSYAIEGYNALDTYISNLIKGCYITEEDARNNASKYSIHFPPIYTLMTIQCSDHAKRSNSMNLMRSRIEAIFPSALVSKFNDSFVLIIPSTYENPWPKHNEREFINTLKENGAYAASCFPSRYAAGVAELYNLSLLTIQLGIQTDPNKPSRLFEFKDYHLAIILKLCDDALMRSGLAVNMIHLCNPKILRLRRYDIANNDHLVGLVEKYYENNCNTTKTAEDLFMHRNTLTKKIELAGQIMTEDINDSNFQLVYRMSYLTIKYIEQIQGKNVSEIYNFYGDSTQYNTWE